MFRDLEHRSHRQNVALAGALALVAGMVNTLGFLKEGVFTSHVTGHAGQLSLALSLPSDGTLWPIAARILAFFLGAMIACVAIEGSPWQKKAYVYSLLLSFEAALLLGAMLVPAGVQFAPLSLFAAMGLQNGLVTRLSGAVVRTTHLTGVVTDLGIEAARWGLHLVSGASARRLRQSSKVINRDRPNLPKSLLLLTILAAFLAGGAGAAWLFKYLNVTALAGPIALLVIGGALAFRNGMETLGPQNRQ